MPDQLQLRGGTTTEHNSFTGVTREVTVDTTKKTLVVHDGSTAGGNPVMRESGSNAASTVGIGTGGTNAINIDSSQRVGVATTSAGGKLAILSKSSSYEGLELQTPAGDASGEFHIGVHQSGATSGRTIVFKRGGADGMTTESLRIDADGKVGIGTSPSTNLHVQSSGDTIARVTSADGSAAFLDLGDVSDPDGGRIHYDSGSNLVFNTASLERMRVSSAGRLGIGVSNPTRMLHIKSESNNATHIALVDADSSGEVFRVGQQSDGDAFLQLNEDDGTVRIQLEATGNSYFTGGNVGIGTNSPAEELVVRADAPSIQLESSNGSGRNYGFQTTNDGRFQIYDGTAGVNRLTLNSAGNVGIGTTTIADDGDHCKLVISGQAQNAAGILIFQDTSNNEDGMIFADNGSLYIAADRSNASASSNIIFRVDGSNERMRLDSNGNLGIGESASLMSNGKLTVKIDTNKHIGFNGSQGELGSVPALVAFQDNGSLADLGFRGNILKFATTTAQRMHIGATGNVSIGAVDSTSTSAVHIRSGTTAETTLELSTKDNYNGSLPSAKMSFTQQNGTEIARIKCDTVTAAANQASLTFWTNQGALAERMRINQAGHVGIGTTVPQALLSVQSGSISEGSIMIGANYDGSGLANNSDKASAINAPMYDSDTYPNGVRLLSHYSSNTTTLLQLGGGTNSARAATSLIFYTAANKSANGSEKMRLIATGELGVGLSPTAGEGVLQLNGGLRVAGSGAADDTTGPYLFRTSGADHLNIATSGVTRFQALSTGEVLVGKGSTSNAAPGFMIDNSGKKVNIHRDDSNTHLFLNKTGSNTGIVATFAIATATKGTISITSSATSYNTSSDYRLKENIVSISDGITRLKQLLPKRFNFIADETNTLCDGFLAHEVSSTVPEAITGTKDAVDSEGNIDPQQIDQSKLVPLLVAAVQELIGKVETLEAAA